MNKTLKVGLVQQTCSANVEYNKQKLAKNIAEVAAQVGYENYKSFYRAFKDAVGTTPVEYQQKKYRIHREDEKQ